MTLGDRIVVMQGGIIQQADTPLEVYRRPANRFVASFVGTPPMNFFEGRLVKRADGLAFVETDASPGIMAPLTFGLGVERSRALADHAEKSVVLGLRPQGLRSVGSGAGPGVDFVVRVIEPLGDLMDVSCASASQANIVARVSAPAFGGVELKVGRPARFEIDTEHTHVFEPGEFGRRLA